MSGSVPEIDAIEKSQLRDLTPFRVGDTINVHFRIREGEKERIQVFKGVVIRKSRGGAGATFAVRKVSGGVGVERIFPLHSPRIEKVEVAGYSAGWKAVNDNQADFAWAITTSRDAQWMIMDEVMTMSAQSRSSSVRGTTFRSRTRRS